MSALRIANQCAMTIFTTGKRCRRRVRKWADGPIYCYQHQQPPGDDRG